MTIHNFRVILHKTRLLQVRMPKPGVNHILYGPSEEMSGVLIKLSGDRLQRSSTLIKVMLFIPWHPFSLYWGRTLSHTVSRHLYTGTQYNSGHQILPNRENSDNFSCSFDPKSSYIKLYSCWTRTRCKEIESPWDSMSPSIQTHRMSRNK